MVCRSVCRSVCVSVCHTSEPCKNGWTNQDAVWVEHSGGPTEPCIRCIISVMHYVLRRIIYFSPWEGGKFWGEKEASHCKTAEPMVMPFRMTQGVMSYANDTRSRNRRQKPAQENWRRFLASVFHTSCKISGARNQHGGIKSNQTFYLAIGQTHVK